MRTSFWSEPEGRDDSENLDTDGNNIKIGIQEMDSSLLEWNRALWRGLVDTTMNLCSPLDAGNCLSC
jgi:hypothetical protein